jgi:hypothetical protein
VSSGEVAAATRRGLAGLPHYTFITNLELPTVEADQLNRRHAVVELTIRDLTEAPTSTTAPPATSTPTRHACKCGLLVHNLSAGSPSSPTSAFEVTVDAVEAAGVGEFVDGLAAAVRAGMYRPQPLRRVHIPKPGKPGQTRPLGIPTVPA